MSTVHEKIDMLLEALARTDGQARQQLAEANLEALRTEIVFQRAGQLASLSADLVKKLEAALAIVRQAQETPPSGTSES